MIFVTLISYKYMSSPTIDTPAQPGQQTELMSPIPVEHNVPATDDTPWDQRLENVVQIYSKDKDGNIVAVGTGWFVKDHAGLIMTDAHVLAKDSSTFQINLKDGRTYVTNNILWSSEKDDLAKLQLQTSDKLPDGFAICTEKPQIAEDVWLIGNPFDMPWSVHKGIIASPSRSNVPEFKRLGFNSDYMEIDIVELPGMSGGPFITKDDCVIGMASFLYAVQVDKNQSMTLSFASKTNKILDALNAK